MRAVAEEMKVPLIDLYTESFRIVETLGEEGSRKLFMHVTPGEDPASPDGSQDNAHTRREGAERFAAFVARELISMGYIPQAATE